MGADSSMDSETGTGSSKTLMKRQNTMIQYLKSQFEKSGDGSCIRLPGCSARTMYERISDSGNPSLSWSVMKKISSVFRLRTVSCLTHATTVQTNEHLRKKSDNMSLEEEINNFIAAETGMDRLRRARYNRYRENEEPQDLQVALKVGTHAGFLCFLGAFIKYGTEEMEAFKLRSRTKLFGTQSLFIKRLAYTGIEHGTRKGIRFGLFGFTMAVTFSLVWRGVCIYFNTSSFWTFGVAAGTVLSTWKFNLGPRGMFAGFVIGNSLGSFMGVLLSGMLKVANSTQQQINYEQVKLIVETKREYRKHGTTEAEVYEETEKMD